MELSLDEDSSDGAIANDIFNEEPFTSVRRKTRVDHAAVTPSTDVEPTTRRGTPLSTASKVTRGFYVTRADLEPIVTTSDRVDSTTRSDEETTDEFVKTTSLVDTNDVTSDVAVETTNTVGENETRIGTSVETTTPMSVDETGATDSSVETTTEKLELTTSDVVVTTDDSPSTKFMEVDIVTTPSTTTEIIESRITTAKISPITTIDVDEFVTKYESTTTTRNVDEEPTTLNSTTTSKEEELTTSGRRRSQRLRTTQSIQEATRSPSSRRRVVNRNSNLGLFHASNSPRREAQRLYPRPHVSVHRGRHRYRNLVTTTANYPPSTSKTTTTTTTITTSDDTVATSRPTEAATLSTRSELDLSNSNDTVESSTAYDSTTLESSEAANEVTTRRPGPLSRADLFVRSRDRASPLITSRLPSTGTAFRKLRPTEATATTIEAGEISERPVSEESRTESNDQSSRAQEVAVSLADPPSSESTNPGHPSTRDIPRRRISTTVTPRIESATTGTLTTATNSVRTTAARTRTKAKSIDSYSAYTSRPRRPQIVDYDYYFDDAESVVGKSNTKGKLFLTSKGQIQCLDQGNFPHPFSCKKFITCARMVNGLVIGSEYTCPKSLSFDPVGGICNWSAGLGCKE